MQSFLLSPTNTSLLEDRVEPKRDRQIAKRTFKDGPFISSKVYRYIAHGLQVNIGGLVRQEFVTDDSRIRVKVAVKRAETDPRQDPSKTV